jgi:hypothetical protein
MSNLTYKDKGESYTIPEFEVAIVHGVNTDGR